jgi:hypothetical protein
LIIEIDDEKSSAEKIELQKSGDDRYFPKRTSANEEVGFILNIGIYKDYEGFVQRFNTI